MRALALLFALLLAGGTARAQVVSPHAIEIPDWFTESLLEMRDEVKEAAA